MFSMQNLKKRPKPCGMNFHMNMSMTMNTSCTCGGGPQSRKTCLDSAFGGATKNIPIPQSKIDMFKC